MEARQEIARLLGDPQLLSRCPPGWENPKLLLEHGLANIVRVAKAKRHLDLAFKASVWLVEYTTALMQAKGSGGKGEALEVVAELRTLYAKALPKRENFLESSDESKEPKE